MVGSSDELDRIERQIDIDTDAQRVWALISEPGWWINDGEIVSNPIVERRGAWVVLRDAVHGAFAVQTVRFEPPRYAAFRWKPGETLDATATTLVEFRVSERPGGVRLLVVESGFAALGDDRAAALARREENTKGWETELSAAQARLDPVSVRLSAQLPTPVDDVWPLIVDAGEFARWYAFGGARIDPVAGGGVELRWDEHGAFHGRVREVIPAERFSFLLAVEPDTEPAKGKAPLVTFDLRSYGHGGGSLVTVRQSGYEDLDEGLGTPGELAEQDRESWQAGLELLAERVTEIRSARDN